MSEGDRSGDPEARADDILAGWIERVAGGESLDPAQLLAEHEDLAEQLRARLHVLEMLERESGNEPTATDIVLRRLAPGRYEGFEPVGEGGMGLVYLAQDVDLHRPVAFKVIRTPADEGLSTTPRDPLALSPPPDGTEDRERFRMLTARFLTEAWVTGSLTHPGILPVYELGQTDDGVPYYTMRYIEGETTLATLLERASPEDLDARLALLEPFLRICDTLAYAHAHGVIHRDLKPENVAIGRYGEVVVLDWGLAKLRGAPTPDDWRTDIFEAREQLARATVGALGTPGYMPPEAAGDPDAHDARTDVYSLGAILYEILTGRVPYRLGDREEFEAWKRGDLIPPRARAPQTPEGLSAICARCLAREPKERYADIDALAQDVRDWRARQSSRTRSTGTCETRRQPSPRPRSRARRSSCRPIGRSRPTDRFSGCSRTIPRLYAAGARQSCFAKRPSVSESARHDGAS